MTPADDDRTTPLPLSLGSPGSVEGEDEQRRVRSSVSGLELLRAGSRRSRCDRGLGAVVRGERARRSRRPGFAWGRDPTGFYLK